MVMTLPKGVCEKQAIFQSLRCSLMYSPGNSHKVSHGLTTKELDI